MLLLLEGWIAPGLVLGVLLLLLLLLV